MTREEAQEYAKTMSYKEAVLNCIHSKGIAYRKASLIKLQELAEIADKLERDNDMTREEAIYELQEDKRLYETEVCHAGDGTPDGRLLEALDMAIEALSVDADKLVRCEDCRYRNTWDNPRLEPQYYKCGRGVKFRDYGYVREDDYCPLGERRDESEVEE